MLQSAALDYQYCNPETKSRGTRDSIVGSILVADRILLTDSWIFASIGQQKQQINVVMNTRARHVQTNLQHCLVGEPLMCLGSQKCGCCLTNRLHPIEVMTFDHVIMSSRHFRRHFLFQPLDSQLHGVAHGHHGWFGNYGVKKEILHCHFCNGTVTKPVHKFNRWTVQDWVPTPKHVLITKNEIDLWTDDFHFSLSVLIQIKLTKTNSLHADLQFLEIQTNLPFLK